MSDRTPEPEEPRRDSDLFDEFLGASDEVADPADEPQTVDEPAPTHEPASPGEQPSEPSEPRAGGKPPRRARWPWLILGLVIVSIVLIGWTKAVNSTSFCTRCHSMQASADTAAHSVHSDVSCISCHRGVGVPGAVAYIPTFVREVVDQLTPLSLAGGTMDAAPCEKCHTTIFTTPLLKGEHPSTGCNECHGNTVHPGPPAPTATIENPHPSDWIDFHGREATRNPESCATCHLIGQGSTSNTCMACHFRGQYPHPKNWIPTHGQAQQQEGPDACTLCHAPLFCSACHGTEIPHDNKTWLPQHPGTVIENGTAQQCLLCHAVTDCTNCHIRHGVHKQQGLYPMEKP